MKIGCVVFSLFLFDITVGMDCSFPNSHLQMFAQKQSQEEFKVVWRQNYPVSIRREIDAQLMENTGTTYKQVKDFFADKIRKGYIEIGQITNDEIDEIVYQRRYRLPIVLEKKDFNAMLEIVTHRREINQLSGRELFLFLLLRPRDVLSPEDNERWERLKNYSQRLLFVDECLPRQTSLWKKICRFCCLFY